MADLMTGEYLPHLFLLIAAILIHFASRSLVLIPIGLALVSGLLTGGLDGLGAALLIALSPLLWSAFYARSSLTKWLCGLSGFVLATLLSDHQLPGFRSLPVFDRFVFTPTAVPFSMHFTFDKTVGGLLILLWVSDGARRFRGERSEFMVVAETLTALILAIMPAALLSGYVAFEPRWPSVGWVWALNNLFFVAMAEEALYRGFLLEMLLRWRPNARAWVGFALVVSSVAFGLAHYRTGTANVVLAAFAGLFYGYAYVKTRRIHASMMVHFGLNLVHFVFFTYPALRR